MSRKISEFRSKLEAEFIGMLQEKPTWSRKMVEDAFRISMNNVLTEMVDAEPVTADPWPPTIPTCPPFKIGDFPGPYWGGKFDNTSEGMKTEGITAQEIFNKEMLGDFTTKEIPDNKDE